MKLRKFLRESAYGVPFISGLISRQFHRLYYYRRAQTWRTTRWFGTDILKCPLDLWVYQELFHELRPDLVIETGTAWGGSAHYMASLFDLLGAGRIVTIDVEPREGRPVHPRITYLTGSSTDPAVVEQVQKQIGDGERVMVILDSDHSRDHVLKELRTYAPMVSLGSYCVVEDSNVNGHPVSGEFGPGPMEAIRAFLGENRSFEIDRAREKYFLTFNPCGYLKRVR